MPAGKNTVLWFSESTNQEVTHYELDTFQDGNKIGDTQTVSIDDSVDGVDENAGEIELRLNSITALPSDAVGFYSFYIYAVDPLGRSQTPLNVFDVELDFIRLNPANQDKKGVLLKNSTQPYFSSIYPEGNR